VTGGRFTSLPRGELAASIFQALGDRVETIFDDSIAELDDRAAPSTSDSIATQRVPLILSLVQTACTRECAG